MPPILLKLNREKLHCHFRENVYVSAFMEEGTSQGVKILVQQAQLRTKRAQLFQETEFRK
jgi:hypothetical protein